MDWVNSLYENGYALIAQLGINVGTIGLVAWNTFVSTRLGAKRVDRLFSKG